jgi:DNA polymerase III beta subunit
MDVTIPRSALIELAKHGAQIAPAKSPSGILTHVRVEARAGKVTLRATDHCMIYEGSRAAVVDAPGCICIPARTLRDVAMVLHEGDVRVTRKGSSVTLATGKRRFTLPILDGEDYPTVAHAPGAGLVLDAHALAATLRRTHYAQGTAAAKYQLAATRLTVHGTEVHAEATDGHRAARSTRDGAEGGDAAMLAPVAFIERVMGSLVPDGSDPAVTKARVELTAAPDRITLDVGDDRWTTLMFRDELPDPWGQVPAHTSTVRVDRGELIDALNATALAADNNDRVVFTCEPDERRLSLSAEVAGDRAVSDELAATFDGDAPPRRWALNRRYALDTLRALECPRVDLRLIDERHPVQIADPDDARSQAVIMPMGV